MTITYHCLQGAAGAEAKLMLASILTLPSNGFVFHKCITKDPWCKIRSTVLGHKDKRLGLLSIVKSNDNNIALYDNQLFLRLIALGNALKRILELLTSESNNIIIQ